ncbi:MAG: hypothetical protein ACO3F9_12905 [Burkholderiales bacterium]
MSSPVKAAFIVTALAALGGCVAVPVHPVHYEPATVYYTTPAYYGPSISFGIYGGRQGHHHGGRRGHRRH